MVDLAEEAKTAALVNALDHDGEAQPGAVVGRLMAAHPELRDRPDEVQAAARAAVDEVNALSEDDQRAELEALDPSLVPGAAAEGGAAEAQEEPRGLPDLPDVDGDVIMRFAPNPNGPPTLGHTRGMVVNGEYVDRHGGTLILRFDDTDPQVKPPMAEAYGWFEEDYAWLGYNPDVVFACSDRLDAYHEHARTLLARGQAYVCACEREAFQDHRAKGVPCDHRTQDPGAAIEAFDAMMLGGTEPGEAVVRIKTDMGHKDPALRDWVALRVVDPDAHPHPRTGTDRRVWPMLDFASAIEDHLRGVTHIIRGKDLRDSTGRQRFLYDHFGWDYPATLYWGRIRLHEGMKFSTSSIKEAIAAGEYTGWNDPRLPTLRGLARRGFQPEAIRSLWVQQGLTEKDVALAPKNLDAENRKVVDPVADRFFFVADPQTWTLTGATGHAVHAPLHPDDPDRGFRDYAPEGEEVEVHLSGDDAAAKDRLADGAEVRLKDFVNARVASAKDRRLEATDDDVDRAVDAQLPILHFVLGEGIDAEVLMPDGKDRTGVCEPAVLDAPAGEVVQFERFGFCRLETVEDDDVVAVFGHR